MARTKATSKDKQEPVEKKIETVVEEESMGLADEPSVPIVPNKIFHDGDYIMCRSIVAGGLNITCRSSNYYRFVEYGGECEIEYRDLVELIRIHSDHIFLPRIIIEDKDFLEQFPQVRQFYESLYTTEDLRVILGLPNDKMEFEIQKLPREMFDTLRGLASSMISSGEIDSVNKIRCLSKIFNADYNLISEMLES